MEIKPWTELERLSLVAAMLHRHLKRAAEYGDESEIRRIRAEIAIAAKQRKKALYLLCQHDIYA